MMNDRIYAGGDEYTSHVHAPSIFVVIPSLIPCASTASLSRILMFTET
jgi:hypothetical protein